MKVNKIKFVILALYVGDILLTINDIVMLHDVKKFIFKYFEIKDTSQISYVWNKNVL